MRQLTLEEAKEIADAIDEGVRQKIIGAAVGLAATVGLLNAGLPKEGCVGSTCINHAIYKLSDEQIERHHKVMRELGLDPEKYSAFKVSKKPKVDGEKANPPKKSQKVVQKSS